MSSTDSTEIAKTDDSSLASDLDKSLSDSISKKFSNVEIAYVKPDRIRVNVKKEDIIDVASFIRDELNFDHAESVSGVDYPEDKQIEVVYHLGSYTDTSLDKKILALATRTYVKMIHILVMIIQYYQVYAMFSQAFHFMKENVSKC